ncbi:glycine zipper 2TM domain-containing protein [Rhodoferax saidenbachensis]|uniref:Osmotically-inducible lipoprotein B n=1 Tax=Rhodoferax saidenbachensis TaxID=1484693 RepID=A0A1P8K701_9BURK|nr:glycine zipper 2TM domain-containing protein [Rhodoferax saidenbachensis]APW41787.1 osmotically-inducible lipoprotein B [Rhodoferax saidenbachensis]
MKFAQRVSACLPALLLVSAVALSGCAGMTQQEKGTAAGAVIGGVVGNAMCGGVLCTGAGAAVGGVIGHEATKK